MLTIHSLTKTYENGVKALDNVSLTITNGLFGLLGPNGAGKSSLMRTIATLQNADSGSIHFDTIDVLKEPQKMRENLGYLPQEFGVYPRISAFDLLDHFAIMKGINNKNQRQDSVNHLLSQTNLYSHRHKAVSGFSGGMRQRFGIAQALLGNPDLLIVDEPTAGLDPEERNRFNNLLAGLGEKKVVILSTHIVDDVAELCENMAVLAGGKIIKKGNPLSLIDEIQNGVWRKSVAQAEVGALEAELPVISKRLYAGRVMVHVFADQAPPGFESTPAQLEDVYFSALMNHRNASAL